MGNNYDITEKILLYVRDSVIVLSIAIVLVGFFGAIGENIWLGKLGSEEYKEQGLKQKSVVPSIMFFFPLPFTTYTYVFFRVIFGMKTSENLKSFLGKEWNRIRKLRIKLK